MQCRVLAGLARWTTERITSIFKRDVDPLAEAEKELGDLRARLMTAEMFAQVLLQGYHALRSYRVDFMKLWEWEDDSKLIDDARRLKPKEGAELLMRYLMGLENAIKAAVRRTTSVRKVIDNTTTSEPTD